MRIYEKTKKIDLYGVKTLQELKNLFESLFTENDLETFVDISIYSEDCEIEVDMYRNETPEEEKARMVRQELERKAYRRTQYEELRKEFEIEQE